MSTLRITKGETPLHQPFDASKENWANVGLPVSFDKIALHSGDILIQHPFSVSYQALPSSDSADSAPSSSCHSQDSLASLLREKINAQIQGITSVISAYPALAFRAEWALTELLTNATQYGRLTPETPRVGLVRLAWEVAHEPAGPTLALAVSNPCYRMFNPGLYPLSTLSELISLNSQSCNAHMGTITLLGYLHSGTCLSYVWHTSTGEVIKVGLSPMQEDSSSEQLVDERTSEPTEEPPMSNITIQAEKYSETNDLLPYSFEEFLADVEKGLPVQSLTVACVIGVGSNSFDNTTGS